MRRISVGVFGFILLALNWAALHDIIKGEPNVWMEWSVVSGSAILLVLYLLKKVRQPA